MVQSYRSEAQCAQWEVFTRTAHRVERPLHALRELSRVLLGQRRDDEPVLVDRPRLVALHRVASAARAGVRAREGLVVLDPLPVRNEASKKTCMSGRAS